MVLVQASHEVVSKMLAMATVVWMKAWLGSEDPLGSSLAWLSAGGLNSFLAAEQNLSSSPWGPLGSLCPQDLAADVSQNKWSGGENEGKAKMPFITQHQKLHTVTFILFFLFEGNHWGQPSPRRRRIRPHLLKEGVSKNLWIYLNTTTAIKAGNKPPLFGTWKTYRINRIPTNVT